MQKNTGKRALSLFLALIMLLSMLSIPAFAEEFGKYKTLEGESLTLQRYDTTGDTIDLPKTGVSEAQYFVSATLAGGAPVFNPQFTWSVTPTTGITLDPAGSFVTVKVSSSALTEDTTYTLKASLVGSSAFTTTDFTVVREPAVLTAVSLGANPLGTTVAVPKVSETSSKKYTPYPTVTCLDQYGLPMTPGSAVWSLEPEGQGVILNAKTGELAVSNTAIADTYTLTLTADGKTASGSALVTKESPVPTTIESEQLDYTVSIPLPGAEDVTVALSAYVLDQYGVLMPGCEISMSETELDGFSFDSETNTVTVTSEAPENDPFKVRAKTSDGSDGYIFAYFTVTAKAVQLSWDDVSVQDITYGQKTSEAVLLDSTTTKVTVYDGAEQPKELEATFYVVNPDGFLPAGDSKTVTVQAVVTDDSVSEGDRYYGTKFEKQFQVDVAKKELSVSWNADTLVYNGEHQVPSPSVKPEELVGSDAIKLKGASSSFSARMPGDYTATASIDEDDSTGWENYVLKEQGKQLSYKIVKRPVTLSGITMSDKVYNGTTTASFNLFNMTNAHFADGDICGDDEVSAIVMSGTFEDANAGTGKTVTFTPIMMGAWAMCYEFSESSQTTLTAAITPKELENVTWGNTAPRDYDGEPSDVKVIGWEGVLEGDSCNIITSNGDRVNVGTYTATADTNNPNYKVPEADATCEYTINKIDYDMTGITFENRSYEYNGEERIPELVGTLPTGLDDIPLTVSYSAGATHVSDGAVTVTATFASDSGNYNVPSPMQATVTITPKSVAVEWSELSLVYNATQQGPEATVTTGVAGDTIVPVVDGKQTDSGTHTATASTANTDYTLTNQTTFYTINQKPISISGLRAKPHEFNPNNLAVEFYDDAQLVGIETADIGSVSYTASGAISQANNTVGQSKPVIDLDVQLTGDRASHYILTQLPTGLTVDVCLPYIESVKTSVETAGAEGNSTARKLLAERITGEPPVIISGCEAATARLASESAKISAAEELAATKLAEAGLAGEGYEVLIQPHFMFKVLSVTSAANDLSKIASFRMDIHPEYLIIASTAESAETMTWKGAHPNAVILATETPTIEETVKLRMPLPNAFVNALTNKTVYIIHKGTCKSAVAQGEEGGYYVEFENAAGFSEFTFSNVAAIEYAASIGSANYTTLQEAVTAVTNGQTINLLKNCSENITVSRTVSFTLNKGSYSYTGSITAGEGYENKGSGSSYRFAVPGGNPTPSGGGGGGGTVKPVVKKLTKFTDVPAQVYYEEAVAWAVDNGIANGLSETIFGSDQSCTRAQVVTFLWRLGGSPAPETAVTFSDVGEDAYFADAVAWAVEKGITKGTTETTFSPYRTCNRAEIVTFLARYAGTNSTKIDSRFGDVPMDAYYAASVAWAVANGITEGTTATTFSPKAACTRAQVVTFMYRFAK